MPWDRSDDAESWRAAAAEASMRGDAMQALRCWLEVRKAEPEAMDAWFRIACCYALLGDRHRACLLFENLIDRPGVPAAIRQESERLLAWLDPHSV